MSLIVNRDSGLSQSRPERETAIKVSRMQFELMSVGIKEIERFFSITYLPSRYSRACQPRRHNQQVRRSDTECDV
jgi:hypothetical protein